MVLNRTQRPLCIDSKVVERIDRLSAKDSDFVYRCAVNKTTPYSSYFGQEVRDLSTRIQQTERLLESFEPFHSKVQITIVEDRPLLYRIQGHHLFVGEKLLKAPGHLEKALIKIWYEENNSQSLDQPLTEEVATDFILFLQLGDLDIGDPDSHVTTALHSVKWPYVIKSEQAYCESPWKRSEHFVSCAENKNSQRISNDDVVDMSLRPLLVTTRVRAYLDLSMQDRFQFTRHLSDYLKSPRPSEILSPQKLGVIAESNLMRAARDISEMNSYIAGVADLNHANFQRFFLADWTHELAISGFQNAFAEASFDVLFVSPNPLSEDSTVFKDFDRIAKKSPQLQIALRDSNNLWMLPSQYPVPLNSFGKIKANRTIVEKCGGYNFSYVMDYAESTEKLLVVDHCENHKTIQYSKYLEQGAEGFGIENHGIAFVQFHLPSLLMKKGELESVANVFEFIQKRDIDNPSFKSLGWVEVHWSEQANAYQPRAFVDGIEWFRIPSQN